MRNLLSLKYYRYITSCLQDSPRQLSNMIHGKPTELKMGRENERARRYAITVG